jgi:hypothetical protein
MELNLNSEEISLLKQILAEESSFAIGKSKDSKVYDELINKLGVNESETSIMKPDTRVNSVHRYFGDNNWDKKNKVDPMTTYNGYNSTDFTKTAKVLTFGEYDRPKFIQDPNPADEIKVGIKTDNSIFDKKELLFDPNSNSEELVNRVIKFSEIKNKK